MRKTPIKKSRKNIGWKQKKTSGKIETKKYKI
jgi:hypothetical protein